MQFLGVIVCVVLSLQLGACGGSGGGSSSIEGDVSAGQPQRGLFLDSAVSGLWYETLTQSGYTDQEGYFEFLPGEIVSFYLGSTLLGESIGKAEVTPLDLVSVTDHPDKLQNMLRILQTLDADADPSNGIEINQVASDYLDQFQLPINDAAVIFEASQLINDVLAAVTNSDSLTDVLASFIHFRETLLLARRDIVGEVVLDFVGTVWDAEISSTQCDTGVATLVYTFSLLGVATFGHHGLRVDEGGGGSCKAAHAGLLLRLYETDPLFVCANACTFEDLNRVAIESNEFGGVVTTISFDVDRQQILVSVLTVSDEITVTTVLTRRT